MTGLDTNILVRYIMQDDAKQAALATKLVESLSAQSPGFISLVSLVELVWVLDSCFSLERQQIEAALEVVLRAKEFTVQYGELAWQALRTFRVSSADFADCVIVHSAAGAGCEFTMTFDRAAARAAGMTLLR